MKKHLNQIMAIIILAGVMIIGANVQAASSPRIVANIPFKFNVGKTTLPAGKYTVTVLNPSSDRKTLQLRSEDGRSSAIVMTNSVIGETEDDAKLTFTRYGDHYYFAQAQMGGDSTSLAAVKSRTERAEEKTVAASRKSIVVILATHA
jgi:hypothetical protein